VNTPDSRDRSLDHLLRQASGPVSASDQCVDGETLAAWVEGSLPTQPAMTVERHLADCARCQALLAAFVRSEPRVSAAPARATPWWHLRWIVPFATAATAIAVWVLVPSPADQRQELAHVADQKVGATDYYVSPSNSTAPTLPSAVAQSEPAVIPVPAPAQTAASRPDTRAAELPRAAPAAPPPPAMARAETKLTSVEIPSPDSTARWRIVAGSSIERSTDQGAVWERVLTQPEQFYVLPQQFFLAGHAPSAVVVWVVGRAGTIFVTTNGTRFDPVPFPEKADLVSVVAVDDRQATVTTADGRRFATSERGVTWERR
jgi:hypothetical protein